MIGVIVWRLYDMQIINGEGYKNLSDQRVSANITQKAPRGEITDRNGKVLVTNRKGYSIKLQKTGISDEEFNAMLLKLFKILDEDGYTIEDSLPVSYSEPFAFTFENDEKKSEWFDGVKALDITMSPNDVIEYYKEAYKISSDDNLTVRRLAGLRYEMRKAGFSINSPFVLADDVSATVVSKIKERQNEFEGVAVTQDYYRQYTQGKIGGHILGRIGKIYKEEYEELEDKGYGLSDLVGKQGIEKVCEDYLRGTDGSKNIYYGEDSELLGEEGNEVAAIPGNYVVLTIDSNLQRAAEESLERNIKQIAAAGANQERRGGDADSGAVVVLDVKTGDVLALATYPTYDPQIFSESYNELLEDPAKPLWNRAISGTYTPGSTFKPLTAIAALSTGAISTPEEIECDGVYRFYEDYQPKCWIWSEQRKTHGMLDVTHAIEFSCNCFFYETGRRVGISAIDEYASKMGLGEKTGIELPEEVSGNVSSPEYKKTLYKNEEDKKWVGGDTIQTAIGQSYSAFTPIGLANYVATIANGGTLYKTHIIKSIHSSTDGSLVYESKPTVTNRVEISKDNLDAVRRGMLGVADEGSAKQIFSGYPISVGGKTGTAQISSKSSNNALFVSFAPFEEPEIAVCVVIEHGYRGANAAYVARDIYDEYFNLRTDAGDESFVENTNPESNFSELLP